MADTSLIKCSLCHGEGIIDVPQSSIFVPILDMKTNELSDGPTHTKAVCDQCNGSGQQWVPGSHAVPPQQAPPPVPYKKEIDTTPSALVSAHDCQLEHHLNHVERLRKKDQKRAPTLASGTAVHYAVEQWLYDQNGKAPTPEQINHHGHEGLEQEFSKGYTQAERDKQVKRFLPGVYRALGRIPTWVWTSDWVVEANVAAKFKYEDLIVRVHGRPDLYRQYVDQEGTPTIEVVDIKTTKTNPMSYILWSPQVRIYCAILALHHPGHLIVYRYVCVPTGPSDVPYEALAFTYDTIARERTEREIYTYAKETFGKEPRYSRRCDWCTYASICTANVMGFPVDSIIEDDYVKLDKGGHSVVELDQSPPEQE
jgi:hypothetical protein